MKQRRPHASLPAATQPGAAVLTPSLAPEPSRYPILFGVLLGLFVLAFFIYPAGAYPSQALMLSAIMLASAVGLTVKHLIAGGAGRAALFSALGSLPVLSGLLFVLWAVARWSFAEVPALERDWIVLAAGPGGGPDARLRRRRARPRRKLRTFQRPRLHPPDLPGGPGFRSLRALPIFHRLPARLRGTEIIARRTGGGPAHPEPARRLPEAPRRRHARQSQPFRRADRGVRLPRPLGAGARARSVLESPGRGRRGWRLWPARWPARAAAAC